MTLKSKTYFNHPTAIIDDGAIIGENTKIWHWVHICKDAEIGANCTLGQNVFVGSKGKIGNNVKIQNNVSTYDDVLIKDDVFCGPSVVFTNVYNPRSEINRKNEYRKTIVNNGATLGANSTIVCGIEIGEYAFIGAGALVNKNVPQFALMVGVPSKQIGWMSAYGERIDDKVLQNEEYICKQTGDKYYLHNSLLIRIKNN